MKQKLNIRDNIKLNLLEITKFIVSEEIYNPDKVYYVSELSRYIADIQITFDFNLDFVYVKVVTDNKISSNTEITTPIILDGTISLLNKNVTEL